MLINNIVIIVNQLFISLFFNRVLISPNFAGIILGTSDNNIPFIIKSTTEYFISMTFQNLKFFSVFSIPDSGALIGARGEDFGTLGIKGDF